MRQKCKNCDKNCENGDLCFRCKSKSPLPKIRKNPSMNNLVKEVKNIIEDSKKITPMWIFFNEIWRKRSHKSEISEKWLGNELLSIFFHHILPKENHPEAKYDEQNIILLTWEEHDNVEIDMYKYREINKRRELLKIKYNL